MDVVLFVSMHDASRGPMAAALFNSVVDPSLAKAVSAGFKPAREIEPLVVKAMRPDIDLTGYRPQRLTPAILDGATLIVDIGIGATAGTETELAWKVPLIRPISVGGVHLVRADLEQRIAELSAQRGWVASSVSGG